MLNVNNKQDYYADSKAKELNIILTEKSDFGGINFYAGDMDENGEIEEYSQYYRDKSSYTLRINKDPASSDATKYINSDYIRYANFMRVGICMNFSHIENIDEDTKIYILVNLLLKDGKISGKTQTFDAYQFIDEKNHFLYVDIKKDDRYTPFEKIDGIKSICFGFEATSEKPVKVSKGWNRPFMYLSSVKFNSDMDLIDYTRGYNILKIDPAEYINIVENEIPDINNSNIISESFSLTESLCSADRIKFGLCESSHCSFEIADRVEDFSDKMINPKIKVKGKDDTEISLGFYKIRSSKANYIHNLKKTKITAYDLLATTMEDNAFNWYTSYMTAYNTTNYTQRYGYEVARQIYSSYFNLAKNLGLEDRKNYQESVLFDTTNTARQWIDDADRYFPVGTAGYDAPFVQFGAYQINIDSDTAGQRLVVDLYTNYTPQDIKKRMPRMYSCEPYGRGITSGNIYIKEFRSGGKSNIFCVDSGDYFMIAPDTTKIWIYFAYTIGDGKGTPLSGYADRIKISKVNDQIDLTNGWIRLMYYDYSSGEIFSIDTTVKARDVMRSLIEPCGAFFKLDRNGKPKFLYADKAGLYPSNKLYPANDLYPIKADFEQATMGHYMSFEYENYVVTNYGKIQIVKNDVDNSNKALVQWEYKGSNERNTYLIDDNIFYSNPALEYEFDSMPEVSEMLENMYIRIANLSYIPHYTKAMGLPFMETGDRLMLLTQTGGIESFIFRRTLKGINNLQDNYEAEGVQYTKAISDYAYKEWR